MNARFFLLTALLATQGALAADPAVRPQLLLHTDAHVARIRQVSADADARYLLTASEDKTARIWDLVTGELRRTWVPPMGAGDEGKLFAAALSPDGKTAVVGGWTSDGAKGFAVHFFDRTSGALVRRVGGLRNVIHQLAWSTDGRLLAVATAGGGLTLLRGADGKVIGEDRDYGDTANGIHFSRTGALATVADDGVLRVYEAHDSSLTLRAKKTLTAGKRPTAVRFSPDGSELAVLYEDNGNLEIFSASGLKSAHVVADPKNAGLSRLAWTPDGRLIAGGHLAENRHIVLRVWDDRGRGGMRTVPLPATNSVFDLIALANGRVVAATADPLWAVVDARSTPIVSKSAATDFRALLSAGLRVAANGERVFIPKTGGGYVSFGFDDRIVSERAAEGPRLAAGLGDAVVKRERDGDYLQAGEVRYALERHEQPRVLIASPSAALVGSEWFLRLYDARGTLQWKTALPATAWAVAAVDGGRKFVAALGDGTIRWYNRQDGQELVAFFLKSDNQRWVAWTPAGYYDTSPGGENLLGWVLAAGERADFYPISRFRADYFQPDRVKPTVPTMVASTTAAPVVAPKKTPPVVEVLAPEDGSAAGESVSITLRVRRGSAAPEKFMARVNGRLATTMTWADFERRRIAAGEDGERYRFDLPLDAGENDVQLFAASADGVSTPASLKLSFSRPATPAPAAPAPTASASKDAEPDFSVKPKLYVLAVGVSKYKDANLTLGFSAKDANDFARTVGMQKGRLYRDVEIRLLDDSKATHDAVLDGLEWLRAQVTARDVGMLFIAGHGVNDSDGGYYYLPFDTDLAALKRTGVIFSEIRNTMANLAGKALFFIDTCHSGNVLGGGRRGVPADMTGVINELASAENGVVVFSSSTGRQYSLESSAWGNGAFTKALIEGLQGQADFSKRGRITHKMLDFFLAERVKQLTEGKQTPVTQAPGGVPDFPIAVY